MNEQQFAKKIVSYLNESPISQSVEERLSIARKNALNKAKKENFVEINHTPVITLKSKNNWHDNYFLLMGLSGILILGLLIQNSLRDTFFPNEISITSSSIDYENYLISLNQKNLEFQKWDIEVENLLTESESE